MTPESTAPPSALDSGCTASNWLTSKLLSEGYPTQIVQDCEHCLVISEGFLREQDFASLDAADFTRAYLKSIGIIKLGIQTRLLALQK